MDNDTSWSDLTFAAWCLAGEAGVVIWLRGWRLMLGGRVAEREARRMVTEKLVAGITLVPAMVDAGLGRPPQELGKVALDHFARPVRANRKRLTASLR